MHEKHTRKLQLKTTCRIQFFLENFCNIPIKVVTLCGYGSRSEIVVLFIEQKEERIRKQAKVRNES